MAIRPALVAEPVGDRSLQERPRPRRRLVRVIARRARCGSRAWRAGAPRCRATPIPAPMAAPAPRRASGRCSSRRRRRPARGRAGRASAAPRGGRRRRSTRPIPPRDRAPRLSAISQATTRPMMAGATYAPDHFVAAAAPRQTPATSRHGRPRVRRHHHGRIRAVASPVAVEDDRRHRADDEEDDERVEHPDARVDEVQEVDRPAGPRPPRRRRWRPSTVSRRAAAASPGRRRGRPITVPATAAATRHPNGS